MLATPIMSAKEVVGLTKRDSAAVDLENVMRHFNRIMSLLRRKCKGRCLLKRVLEEYCAFRLGVFYFEKHFEISFDDEARLVEELKRVAESLEI